MKLPDKNEQTRNKYENGLRKPRNYNRHVGIFHLGEDGINLLIWLNSERLNTESIKTNYQETTEKILYFMFLICFTVIATTKT